MTNPALVTFTISFIRDGVVDTGFGVCEGEYEQDVTLSALVAQDSGAHCDSELLVIWTDEALDAIARHELDSEELAGAIEHAEVAFYAAEAEQCRLASTRQRLGTARGAA